MSGAHPAASARPSAAPRIVIAPNASMSQRQAGLALALAFALMLAPGLALAACGLWPIALFETVVLAGLALGLGTGLRQNRYREFIYIDGPELRIEYGRLGTGPSRVMRLPRDWVRVALCTGPYRNSPSRLLLTASGRAVEVGHCLTDAEREQLSLRLRQLSGSAWNPPSPPRGAAIPAAAQEKHA
jgi:uncharacterized membrane protein